MLRRIASDGRDGFYEGDTAGLIVDEMKKGGGIVTREDLERYEPKWREPVAFTYRGHQVISMPPPSSGGVTLAMIAQQLEVYDLARLGWHSAPAVHVQAEAMRRAFAVRNDALGDPDFVTGRCRPAVVEGIRARTAGLDRHGPRDAVNAGLRPVGQLHDGPHTTHFSVVDAAATRSRSRRRSTAASARPSP